MAWKSIFNPLVLTRLVVISNRLVAIRNFFIAMKTKVLLKASSYFIPTGLLVGGFVTLSNMGNRTNGSYNYFFLEASLAIFSTSIILWWALVVRPEKHGLFRYMFTGALIGFFSHFLCWFIHFSINSSSITNALDFKLIFSFGLWSLFLYGYVTIGLGFLTGGAIWSKRYNSK